MSTRFISLASRPIIRRARPTGRRAGRRVALRLRRALGAVAFWSGIVLPLGYLPLMARGIETLSGFGLVLGLIGLHLVALIVGRHHPRG